MASLSNSSPKSVRFSYHKNHQEFVFKISSYLKNADLPVWINIENGIDEERDGAVGNVSVLVCFLTPMYQASKHCQEEVRHAKKKGINVIAVHLLPNWKPSGWLNKITNDLLTVDFRGINQKNFEDKVNQLREKIVWLSDNTRTISELPTDEPLLDRSIFSADSNIYPLIENINVDCSKKKPLNYRILPEKCRLNLSNLMICNNEYILIHGNDHLHLFDRNLKLIRSNNDRKISENDLKDLSWSSDSNSFIILTQKRVYLMNPLTSKLSIIENIRLKDQREEFISCCSSEEKFFLITCQLNSNLFYFEEYYLTTFRFIRKYSIIDFIGIHLFVRNGIFNQNSIEQITSIRYSQEKIAIIMQISSQWFIYVFRFCEQPILLTKIPLEGKSRMTILNPINQSIIFKDYLSNSFIQISMDFTQKFKTNHLQQLEDYSKGFIGFNGKLRSVALFGTSNLVLLVDDTLVIYKL